MRNCSSASFVYSLKKMNAVMKKVRWKRRKMIKEEKKIWIKEIIVGRKVETP